MTEELKALLKAAKTEEEAKEILLAHKSELTDEELEQISAAGPVKWTIKITVDVATVIVSEAADC